MRARRDIVICASDRIAQSNGWSRASSSEQSTGDTPILVLLPVEETTAAIPPVTHALARVTQDALAAAVAAGDSASNFEAFRRGDFERMIALMQGTRTSLYPPLDLIPNIYHNFVSI